MLNKIFRVFKAAIISIIVAFLFIAIIYVIYYFALKNKIETVADYAKIITINENVNTLPPIIENGFVINKPIIGNKYATCKIPSIDVDLPVYYSSSLAHLKLRYGTPYRNLFSRRRRKYSLYGS